jgi:putative membrane protein
MEPLLRPAEPVDDDRILSIQRPDKNLMVLYALTSCLATIAAPIVIIPLYFKYHTLRYKLDREGVSASWGILFRREVHLTYKRIQDIHLKRNFVERWLGIATIQVQTASGSSSSELSFEGIREFEALREFLYRRMRGHEIVHAGGTAMMGGTAVLGAPATAGSATGSGPGGFAATIAGAATPGSGAGSALAGAGSRSTDADVVAILRSIQAEVEATRRALEARI